MGLPRFIKLPDHKRFEYTPRYWDPEKEEFEERVRQIQQEMGIGVPRDPNRTTIKRGSFRQVRQQTKLRASRNSNLRLVIILAILLIIAYLIFFA
jgi:hypothetical protein